MKGLTQKIFNQEIRFKNDDGSAFPDWEEKRLGEVAKVITGKTPSTTKKELWNGTISFITPTDIVEENKYQKDVARTVRATKKLKILPAGTIVYTCIGSIGKIAITINPSITNQQINSLIVVGDCFNEYLYYALQKLTPKIKATQANTTLPIINKTEFSKFKLLFPCKEEQHKIAFFLSLIDQKIERERQILEQYQYQKKYFLQNLFV